MLAGMQSFLPQCANTSTWNACLLEGDCHLCHANGLCVCACIIVCVRARVCACTGIVYVYVRVLNSYPAMKV